jgi:hypothetical protein
VPGRAEIKASISFNAARWSALVLIGLISIVSAEKPLQQLLAG